MRSKLTFKLEDKVRSQACDEKLLVVGVDEAGLGAIAGPVVAAAVLVPRNAGWLHKLDDSKKLTWRQREHARQAIYDDAEAIVGVGLVGNEEVDRLGLAQAHRLACKLAFEEAKRAAFPRELAAVMDGSYYKKALKFCFGKASLFVDRADQQSYSVAAASIVAKTTRDWIMVSNATIFRGYGFEKHKGYCTEEHLRELRLQGPCSLHRRTFMPVKELER